MKISYDWRGMPVEFKIQNTENSEDSTRLTMMYDGSGRRISKTRARKAAGGDWETELVTHYTGIGTEVRDQFHNNALNKVRVVVNMPQGLGRYGVEDDSDSYVALGENDDPNAMFEWYLKNNLGSTMLVYGTQSVSQPGMADFGLEKAAYDYRAFGEQMSIVEPADKVTENFTGKELDDEIALNYFGARYLDPMLGLWISVDAKRQYPNPYLYAGDNPIMRVDPDGNLDANAIGLSVFMNNRFMPEMQTAFDTGVKTMAVSMAVSAAATIGTLSLVAGPAVGKMLVAGAVRAGGMLASGAARAGGMLASGAASVGGLLKSGYNAATATVGANYGKIQNVGEFIMGSVTPTVLPPTSFNEALGVATGAAASIIGNALSDTPTSRPLMPTDGPAPADHTNIAKPFDEE